MAIGTTAAILGSAVIGAGASMMGASAQKKAANKASAAARDNTTANNALAREFYGRNSAVLEPFREQGLRAGATLSELLLGPSAAPAAAPAPQPASYAPSPQAGGEWQDYGGYMEETGFGGRFGAEPEYNGGFPMMHRLAMREVGAPMRTQQYGGAQTVAAPQPAPGAVTTTAVPGKTAWDTFRDSTNYQFRLDEGTKAINQGYAAGGTLQSGAALKALTRYGQDYASNELGNFMNLLAGQQNMGLNAARAVAGVGGDLVTNVTANNNSGASATAAAALARGNATAEMYGDIGAGLGRAIGALGGSSYRKGG